MAVEIVVDAENTNFNLVFQKESRPKSGLFFFSNNLRKIIIFVIFLLGRVDFGRVVQPAPPRRGEVERCPDKGRVVQW